jgi:drug/metabolite transporter (DMT)-like permease
MRVFSAMFGACVAAAVGQILVRRGMLQVGELSGYAPRYLISYFWRALTDPWVIAGTVGNALFYFLFLAALSWADVSVALPLTAIEYVMAAVLGILFLGERVPPLRWAGIGLVVAGVMVIGIDQHRSGTKGAAPPAGHGAAQTPAAGSPEPSPHPP